MGRAQTAQGLYPKPMQFEPFAVSLVDEVLAPARPALALLSAATALLLLIACANVANLLLARLESRRRELAVRTALGAARWHLVRQMLTETLLLGLGGGLLGAALAWGGAAAVAASGIAGIPRAADVHVDGIVLGFAALASLLTALACGVLPALRPASLSLTESLKDGAQNATSGAGRQRLRNALVVAEMALAVVLLVSAGLVLRSLWALQHVRLGFEPAGVLTLRVALPEPTYDTSAKVEQFYADLMNRVRAVPGVTAAGAVRSLPLANTIGDWGLAVEGFVPAPGVNVKGDWQVATDGAFEALGEHLVAGRWFNAADRADSAPVAVVNETLAKMYWKNGDAVGHRIRMGGKRRQAVDHRRRRRRRPPAQRPRLDGEGEVLPAALAVRADPGFPIRNMTLVVRTAGDPMSLVSAVRHEVLAMDPNLPIAAIRPMTDVVASAASTPRFTGLLLGLFATLALTLAAIGIYGVLAYLVSQRTREIGIRMAIGADRTAVLGLVVSRGLWLALGGVAVGLAISFVVARFIGSLLYQVRPIDPDHVHRRARGADARGAHRQRRAGAAGHAGRSDHRAADGVSSLRGSLLVVVHVLGFHASYRCRHAGVCCTSGWAIPVEAPLYRSLQVALEWGQLHVDGATHGPDLFESVDDLPHGEPVVLRRRSDGACVFFEPQRGNLCAIQRQMDHSHLPSACRHFPRVVVIDPRGTFVTLSHLCPTAARMLIDGGPADVVTSGAVTDTHAVGVWEGPRCARRAAAAGPAWRALGLGRLGSVGAIGSGAARARGPIARAGAWRAARGSRCAHRVATRWTMR